MARFVMYSAVSTKSGLRRMASGANLDPDDVKPIGEIPLYARVARVLGGPGRLDGAARSLQFAGPASSARLDNLRLDAPASRALTLWLATGRTELMRLAQIELEDGSIMAMDLNAGCGLALRIDGAPDAAAELGPSGAFSDQAWHHVLLQFNEGSIEVTVDGGWSATCRWARSTTWSALRFGGDAERPWSGLIDAVRLHDRNFSANAAAAEAFAWIGVLPGTRADSIAAFLPFLGNAVNDTGNRIDGVVHGARLVDDRFGHPNAAYRFDSPGAHIELNDSFDAVADEFALAVWVRSMSTLPMDVLAVTPGDDLGLCLSIDAAAISLESSVSTLLRAQAPSGLVDGGWHFVLVQRQADGGLELFVDGKLLSRGTLHGTVFGPGSRVRIGRGLDGSHRTGWFGDLDDLQLHVRTFSAQEVQAQMWLQFRPKDGAGALVLNDRLWLLGGWNTEVRPTTDNEVWSSKDGRVWRLECRAPWEGRHTAGWLAHAGSLWVIGGDRNRGHYQNDVWRSPDGVSWERVCETAPWADRVLFMYASFRDRIWVFGGMQVFESPQTSIAYRDVYSSADGRHWELECVQAPWAARGAVIGSAVFQDKLWVVGGGVYDRGERFNDVWCSADGRSWECVLPAAPWSPRLYHNLVVHRGLLWVIGGSTTEAPGGQSDVWFTADGRRWQRLAGTPWAARHAASAASWRDGLWLGCGSASRLFNDAWSLRPGP